MWIGKTLHHGSGVISVTFAANPPDKRHALFGARMVSKRAPASIVRQCPGAELDGSKIVAKASRCPPRTMPANSCGPSRDEIMAS